MTPPAVTPPHMSPDEFRRAAGQVVEWIARYMEEVERYPVLSPAAPGEVRAKLPPRPPAHGDGVEAWLADLDEILLPGITHWQSPNFFAFFPANASGPAILGELLAAGLGVQGMMWTTSPACTELETHVLDWLVDLLGLPERFRSAGAGGGVIQDTASSATLCALLAARERATGFACNAAGARAPLVAYASRHAHSAVEKAVKIAGVGRENLRAIAVDAAFAMRPEALSEAIAADRAACRVPFFACATIGTTSSTAIDPVRAAGEICAAEGVWLHVDGAYSGAAALAPELRWINDGLELADSYCFNPHKWMLTNFDCDCLYVAERAALIDALGVLPEYLRNRATESGAVFDYRDWQVPLGRRFRALKLWLVIRHYGAEGLRAHIRGHVALARRFRAWVEADERFELAAPAPLGLVCFRHRGGDEVNRRVMETLNASGRLYLTHTRLDGKLTLRMAIGATTTGLRHVDAAWRAVRAAAPAVAGPACAGRRPGRGGRIPS